MYLKQTGKKKTCSFWKNENNSVTFKKAKNGFHQDIMSAYSLVYVCVNPYTRQRQKKKKREDTYSGPKIHNDVEQDIYTNVNQAQQQSQIQGKKEGRNLTVKGKKAQC